MGIRCAFDEFKFDHGEEFYHCIIRSQEIPEHHELKLIGQHKVSDGKTNNDETHVEFRNC